VPINSFDGNSWESLACYPWRTFYSLIDNYINIHYRVTMVGNKIITLCKPVGLQIRLDLIHYNDHIARMFYPVITHPRYFLGGHRPSETSILTNLSTHIYYTLSLRFL